jgi:subtilase family serine protease
MVAPDLVETYLTNPPTNATLGSSFYLTDTAKNIGSAGAGNSVTHYFLSTTTVRDSKSRILQGVRYVPILSPGASSWGTVKATIPAGIPSASYYLLACADDKQVIVEGNETNNCKASSSRVALTTPDLVETGITDPPSTGKVGSRFSITDVVKNYGNASASASVTRYYLSTTNVKSSAAKLLTGSRSIPALNPQALSSGTASITVPSTVPVGYSYYLLACADDTNTVVEVNEINNCKASMTTILITP